MTEKARCAADFERPQESGFWIFDDPPDEDGEARWLRLVAEDGAVTSAVLMGRSYHANGILWKK